MSDSAPTVPGLLVAHGDLARELKTTAEAIGEPGPGLLCLTNRDRTTEALAAEIARALDERGPGTIVMVDLAGGSCLNAALKAARGRTGVTVIAGVNLPLVLDYLQKQSVLPYEELVAHIIDRGHSGLRMVPTAG